VIDDGGGDGGGEKSYGRDGDVMLCRFLKQKSILKKRKREKEKNDNHHCHH
jgi:hypothetical protein